MTKGGNVLRLEVDTQSNHTLGPEPAALADTLVSLHLGGLPGEYGLSPSGTRLWGHPTPQLGGGGGGQWGTGLCSNLSPPTPPEPMDAQAGPPTWMRSRPQAYLGCMRNLGVNQSPVTLPHSARVQGAVGASGCPAT